MRMALAARLLRLERQTNLEVIAERCGFPVAGVLLEALQNALWRDAGRVATG
ncbi:hypothetical protein LNP20_23775 [Klebsiella pneumoniae subsp. pneumoniae]|nr:hypothetical protein [Klebsiella pneumoniae subsp. pneumoniae]